MRKALQPASCACSLQWGKIPEHATVHRERYKKHAACLPLLWLLVCLKNNECSFWKGFPWHAVSQRGKGPEVQTVWEMLRASVCVLSDAVLSALQGAACSHGSPSQGITWYEHCRNQGGRTGTPVLASIPCHPSQIYLLHLASWRPWFKRVRKRRVCSWLNGHNTCFAFIFP